jgi:hypothetical protein
LMELLKDISMVITSKQTVTRIWKTELFKEVIPIPAT